MQLGALCSEVVELVARGKIFSGELQSLLDWEKVEVKLMRAWASFAKGEMAMEADNLHQALEGYSGAFWAVAEPGGPVEAIYGARQLVHRFERSTCMVAMEASQLLEDRDKRARLSAVALEAESRQKAGVLCQECGEVVTYGVHQCRADKRRAYGAMVWTGVKRDMLEKLRACGKCTVCFESVSGGDKIFVCQAAQAHAVCGK